MWCGWLLHDDCFKFLLVGPIGRCKRGISILIKKTGSREIQLMSFFVGVFQSSFKKGCKGNTKAADIPHITTVCVSAHKEYIPILGE